MSRLVPVPVAVSPEGLQVPLGYEVGLPYELQGPDGTLARFNDRTQPLGIGVLDDVTGLDSPEVRSNSEDLTEGDGATFGNFYFGKRPITLNGSIYTVPLDGRNARVDRLLRACLAMTMDCELRWAPTGGVPVMIRGRRNQPPRISGGQGVSKAYSVSIECADPRIYSQALHSQEVAFGGVGVDPARVSNVGRADSYPVSVIYGPATDPQLVNFTRGLAIKFTGLTVAAGQYLTVDHLNKTVMLNDALNRYSTLNYLQTDWWSLLPGYNDLTWTATAPGAGTKWLVMWRDAWL